jgi:uncharacterized membrane protein
LTGVNVRYGTDDGYQTCENSSWVGACFGIDSGLGDEKMGTARVVAFVLIAAGVLALAYGGFTYTKETHEMKIGPIDISVKDKETVNIPIWAGVGAIVIGGLLLVFGSKKP